MAGRRRKIGVLIFIFGLGLVVSARTEKSGPPPKIFKGALGDKMAITMKLNFSGEEISGSYYYEKQKKDIQLAGTFDPAEGFPGRLVGEVKLTESDPKGKTSGGFEGHLSPAGAIRGRWTNPAQTRKYLWVVREAPGPDAENLWPPAGEWNARSRSNWEKGTLDIGAVTKTDFGFYVFIQNGAYMGEAEGVAVIKGSTAEFNDAEHKCRLSFQRQGRDLELDEDGEGCSYYRGAGAYFGGVYTRDPVVPTLDLSKKNRTALTEAGVFEDAERERAFAALVGPSYGLFVDSFQTIEEREDLDGAGAKVYAGGVRGLYTIMEGIIMVGPNGRLWAAVIVGQEVRYFTNVPSSKKKLPKTIEQWRQRFPDKKVIYQP